MSAFKPAMGAKEYDHNPSGQQSEYPFVCAPAAATSMPPFRYSYPYAVNSSLGGASVPPFRYTYPYPAFVHSSHAFGFTPPVNAATSLPAAFPHVTTAGTSVPQNTSAPPASAGTSVPALGQNSATLGSFSANGGTSVPAFGPTTDSVPSWLRYFPPAPINGAAFVFPPTNYGAASVSAPTNGSTSCVQSPAVSPSSSSGASRASSLKGTGPDLFGTQNQLSGSTTNFQTPTINASSSPGFGIGYTTSVQTSTQFGTISNLNETSSCSDEVQSPLSGCQVKKPSAGDSSSGSLPFRISLGGSRGTPYTETVGLQPGSQQSTRFMSISAMPVFRDKSHEELRWEDHQFNNAGGVDPDLAQPNCFRYPVSRTGSSFQNAMPSSVPPNIFASSPPCFTFPTCSTDFTSNFFLNDSRGGDYTSITQPPSIFGPTIMFSHPNRPIISASAPCTSICSTVTTPIDASVPCNFPSSICRSEMQPAVSRMSAEGPKTTSVRYGIFSTPVNHSANEKQKLVLPPECNSKGDGPKVAFSADAHGTPTARTKLPLLPKDNSGILISGPSEEWTLKIDFENISHIKHTSIHVCENGKVSVELSKPLADGFMYQDKVGNPGESFSAEHSLRTISVDGNYPSEKEVSLNAYWLMPKLKDSNYFIEPRVEELAIKESFDPGFCSRVIDLVVGHHRYGRIKFLGETDVRQLDVNSHIVFRNREVILSMDENKKPPVGHGLNKPAEITLCNILCLDKLGNQYINGPKIVEYKKMLMKKAEEQGAEFVSYDAVRGEWKFRVAHF